MRNVWYWCLEIRVVDALQTSLCLKITAVLLRHFKQKNMQ